MHLRSVSNSSTGTQLTRVPYVASDDQTPFALRVNQGKSGFSFSDG